MTRRCRWFVASGLITILLIVPFSAMAQSGQYVFGHPLFVDVWERTDLPVQEGVESRTWIWGPGANTEIMDEAYAEADDGFRQVQYTDKSRMELPVGDDIGQDSDWLITQGLLATELMTGRLQLGDDTFEHHEPADMPVAGDPVNNESPTYAVMGQLIDQPPRSTGDIITEVLTRDGTIGEDYHTDVHGITDAYYVDQTDNNIASVFWDFMNSSGTVYQDGQYQENTPLFSNPFYAIGFPITEAYWGIVTVGGVEQNVLFQCFQRRCLTYAPNNPAGWEVESGNIGQHYYDWRYQEIGDPIDDDESSSPDNGTDEDSNDTGDNGDNGSGDQDSNGNGNEFDDDLGNGDGAFDDGFGDGDSGTGNGDGDTGSGDEDQPTELEPSNFSIVGVSDTTPEVGETFQVTVQVTDQHSDPYSGAAVRARVVDTDGDTEDHLWQWLAPNPASTGGNGNATLTYQGTEAGTDVVGVQVAGISDVIYGNVHWNDPESESSCVSEGESIQLALDNASPNDEVCVESGMFAENLTITTDGVSLVGNGTTLDGSRLSGNTPGIHIDADNVTVTQFRIQNFSGISLLDQNTTGSRIGRLSIAGSDEDLIRVIGTEDTFIDRVSLNMPAYTTDSVNGIVLERAGNDDGFTQIRGIEVDGGNAGILLHGVPGSSLNQATLVQIEHSRFENARNGIRIPAVQGSRIEDNTFYQNQNAIHAGSESGNAPGVLNTRIRNNTIEDNTIGLRFDQIQGSEYEILIDYNLITENNSSIWLRSGVNAPDFIIRDNDFESNDVSGLINDGDGQLNVSSNWWGHDSGPGGDMGGLGDPVYGSAGLISVDDSPNTY